MRNQILFISVLSLFLVSVMILSGCAPSEILTENTKSDVNTNQIFSECKIKSKSADMMGVNMVDTACLMDKAESVAQCKDYQGKEIYSGVVTRYFEIKDVEDCIFSLAIRNNDTNICIESGSKKEECYRIMAINLKNPELCEQAGSKKNICFMDAAVKFSNPDICLRTANVTECYGQYDLYNDDLCGQEAHNWLYSKIACGFRKLNISKDNMRIGLKVCDLDLIPGQLYNEEARNQICMASMGVYLQDTSLCDNAGDHKGGCYLTIAKNNPSFTLKDCDKAGTAYIGCYIAVAVNNKDVSICSQLPTDSKDTCMSQMVESTKDYESCSQIIGDETWRCATKFAQTTPKEKYTLQFCEDLKTGGGGGPPPNQCFYDLATLTLDLNICDKIIGEVNAKEECITIIQHALANK
jgi:hypothetical protein